MATILARRQAMKTYGVVLLLLLIHSPLFLPKFSTTAAAISFSNDDDKQGLLAFKGNLDNASPVFSSWNESSPYCMWKGVYCCSRHLQRVCTLQLPSSGLVGSISPYIGNLSYLRRIDLSDNKIYGIIPSSISHLYRLQNINLTNNFLSGTIPENLDNCSQLVNLSLSNNQFYGKLPSWLGSFRKLEFLNLGVNNFTGGIPLSITNLSSLQQFYLGNNNLLGSIPSDLGQISQIQSMNLGENDFSGFIPESIFNLTYLSHLGLHMNNFHGHLPKDIGIRLSNLKELLLYTNQLTGEIPASLSNASFIQRFDLSSNKFSGTIPVDLGKLCPEYFIVDSNNLEAKVPADWNFLNLLTNCSSLKLLELAGNKLGSLFPSAVANLTSQLQFLDFDDNFIFGEIPSGIENLIGLNAFSVSRNRLTSIIPVGIGKLQNLQALYLGRSNISGTIPFSISNLTKLTVFSAWSNHLSGSIPSNLGNLTQLIDLDLYDNALTGMLPKSMFDMKALSIELDLSYNFLSGTIPKEIGMFVNLGKLSLSRNNLSGEIPKELGSCQLLTFLALDANSFQGLIPSFLTNLKGLKLLNLSSNNFSGAIPKELGLLNDLQELYFQENNLSGHIPLDIENLRNLYMLDISYNNIEGSVPEKGVFSNMSGLVLVGNNRLCGGIPELHLPECIVHRDKKKHLPMLLKLIIPIASIIFLLALISLALLILKWKKTLSRNINRNSLLQDGLLKVSYGELAKATESFSTSNLIGAGMYSRVYKGDIVFNGEGNSNKKVQTVAIKVFDLQQLGSSKSFMGECEALRLIRHRNLIRIWTCCSTIDYNGNDFKALVFDYMPNGNLHRWLHPEIDEHGPLSPLSLTHRLNITIDIADALYYLHHHCQPSVIHCDLKPSNILLGEDLSACVGDFGLAKLLPDPISKSLIESESSIGIRGSIGYVPPEYGEGGPVSAAGDVYSFGVLLLEIFTGRNPTEYMFKDGLTLHNFVEVSYPMHVMDIIDPILAPVAVMESDAFNKVHECLASIIEVGLGCSKQSPLERMSMKDVAIQLHKIRDVYLG
ncbi:Protein kinase superfamily protein [Rhynchospora pubera]|uniref:Receptor kinase-like protein Xa21 n=1 Tax=Rhynchospora pubera TaxID=906938 RepID=A0AAV8DED0_9POAL|nr:Protein kinase superfamily protein [Rhynchospora pubera]